LLAFCVSGTTFRAVAKLLFSRVIYLQGEIMRLFRLLVVAFSFIGVASAEAQYQINFAGEISADHSSFDNSNNDFFFPFITATNNGSPATAFITFTSPDGNDQGYVNNPDNNTATGHGIATTASVVAGANGNWSLSIVDGANEYDYNVNVSLALPFTTLPSIASADLVTGNSFNGTIHFGITGGSSTYPGAATQFHAVFASPDFSTVYANTFLPSGSTSWTPNLNFNGATQALAEIATVDEAVDSTAFVVNSITPISGGEPTVGFSTTNLTYRAENSAVLTVPEPASLSLLALLPLTLCRPRHSAQS
jgi:hypothetical protein